MERQWGDVEMQIPRDCRLYRVVVERKEKGEWKDVRAYVVIASSVEEARHTLDLLFKDENVRIVEEQKKSPYVYLLPEGA
jgi:hypothetical protein